MPRRSGGSEVVDRLPPRSQLSWRIAHALAQADVQMMFGLPGGGANLDLVGAAQDAGLRFVLAHAETEAAIMASSYGLLTRTSAPVVVTRGPGAASAVNGLAQATLDRYPLVVMADTVPARSADRIAHQRIDQRQMLGSVAKYSVTATNETTDDELAALLYEATAWPFGGIHLDVDATALRAAGAAETAQIAGALSANVAPAVSADDGELVGLVAEARALLDRSKRPLVIVGMEAAVAGPEIRSALDQLGCPVLTTYQAIGTVPTEGPTNAGLFTNGTLERPAIEQADLLLTIGLDLVEPIPNDWSYEQPVIRLSSVAQVEPYLPARVEIVADLASAVTAVVGSSPWRWSWGATDGAELRDRARQRLASAARPADTFGPLELVATLGQQLPPTLTTTVDAGAHFLAVMPNWPVDEPLRLLISNGLATMGFAVPAAIGAALARPDEPVLALTGDGGLSMVLAELETIARLALPITVVVFNDSALSLIEIKQGDAHGGSDAVRYHPVDFAAIAEASGLQGRVASSVDELLAIVEHESWGMPRLIDARIDPSAYRDLIAFTRG